MERQMSRSAFSSDKQFATKCVQSRGFHAIRLQKKLPEPPTGFLDQRLFLSPGFPHRRPAELREKTRRSNRRHLVFLPLQGRTPHCSLKVSSTSFPRHNNPPHCTRAVVATGRARDIHFETCAIGPSSTPFVLDAATTRTPPLVTDINAGAKPVGSEGG